jgi:hypothetical protein
MFLIFHLKLKIKILNLFIELLPMKYSFFDLWNDHKQKEEDLPEYYKKENPYINTNPFVDEKSFSDDNSSYYFYFDDEEHAEPTENLSHSNDYPHSVFGLKRSDSDEDMKAKYKEECLRTHPDKGGDPNEFIEIREAWVVYKNMNS